MKTHQQLVGDYQRSYQEYKHILFILSTSYCRPLEISRMISTCDEHDMAFFQLPQNVQAQCFQFKITRCCLSVS